MPHGGRHRYHRGKWKPVILWHIRDNPLRFNEIRQLRELEADPVVDRTVFAEVPPRVEYALTDFGKTVIPILNDFYEWGGIYLTMNLTEVAQTGCLPARQYLPD